MTCSVSTFAICMILTLQLCFLTCTITLSKKTEDVVMFTVSGFDLVACNLIACTSRHSLTHSLTHCQHTTHRSQSLQTPIYPRRHCTCTPLCLAETSRRYMNKWQSVVQRQFSSARFVVLNTLICTQAKLEPMSRNSIVKTISTLARSTAASMQKKTGIPEDQPLEQKQEAWLFNNRYGSPRSCLLVFLLVYTTGSGCWETVSSQHISYILSWNLFLMKSRYSKGMGDFSSTA